MEAEHDSQVAGYLVIDKTLEMVESNLYWAEIAKDIEDYIRSCKDCQKKKVPCHKRHGTLHPLELSYAPCHSVSIVFIIKLTTTLPKSGF